MPAAEAEVLTCLDRRTWRLLQLEASATALGPRIMAEVTAAFGPKCDSFLRVHAEEDPDHVQKALRLAEAVPEAERVLLARNLEQSTYAYCAMLGDIVRNPRPAWRGRWAE